MKLEEKVVVVTGAASGIGRSMARVFSKEGATVVAVDIDAPRLKKVGDELDCETLAVDLCSDEGIQQICKRERIDILCNNAGVLDRLTPLHDTEDALWDKVMEVNLNAPFKLSRAVIKMMLEAGGGNILNTCSAASLSGGRAGCAYTTSKHALLGLTRSIAWYYGKFGIRCNAIAPGAIQTKMHMREAPHPGGMDRYSGYFSTIPEHGKAMDVAEVALFLVSEESRYINGEITVVDGGWNTF